MSNAKTISLLAIGLAAGLGCAWLVRQESDSLLNWQRTLAQKRGAEQARRLIAQVRQRTRELLAEKPLPQNPALRKHLTQNILPGLALYQVLLQENNDERQAALDELNHAFRAAGLAKSRLLLAPLKILPDPFWGFRLGFYLVMRDFPAEGWDFVPLENSADRLAFNATRCFYLNTLTAYGAPELTASFCALDDVMAEVFPPTLRFIRPHTLGRGDTLCDFQYCRAEQA